MSELSEMRERVKEAEKESRKAWTLVVAAEEIVRVLRRDFDNRCVRASRFRARVRELTKAR